MDQQKFVYIDGIENYSSRVWSPAFKSYGNVNAIFGLGKDQVSDPLNEYNFINRAY